LSRALGGPPAVAVIETAPWRLEHVGTHRGRAQSSPSRTRRAVQCQGRSADLVHGTSPTSISGTSEQGPAQNLRGPEKHPVLCPEPSAYLQAPTCYRIEETMDQTKLEEQIAGLAALSDPTRRRLYFFVASRLEGAGREEAAEAVGITRALAAFHLDRLVEDELLVAEYRRLTGRSGPGAGRPAKIYRRSTRQLAISLPQRNYELLARLLAQALMGGEGASSSAALADAAHGARDEPRDPGTPASRGKSRAGSPSGGGRCRSQRLWLRGRPRGCLPLPAQLPVQPPLGAVHGGRLRDEPVPHAGGDLRPPGQRDGGGPGSQSREVLRRVPACVSHIFLLTRSALSLSQGRTCLRSRRPLD
jgi:DNA-binding transcriptional ArsR family regulator